MCHGHQPKAGPGFPGRRMLRGAAIAIPALGLLLAAPAAEAEHVFGQPNKLYWAETAGQRIMQSDIDGSDVETIVNLDYQPRGVGVDSRNRRVYWTRNSPSNEVYRADLDGTNVTSRTLDFAQDIRDVEVEPLAGEVTWTAEDQIVTTDLNMGSQNFIPFGAQPHGLDLSPRNPSSANDTFVSAADPADSANAPNGAVHEMDPTNSLFTNPVPDAEGEPFSIATNPFPRFGPGSQPGYWTNQDADGFSQAEIRGGYEGPASVTLYDSADGVQNPADIELDHGNPFNPGPEQIFPGLVADLGKETFQNEDGQLYWLDNGRMLTAPADGQGPVQEIDFADPQGNPLDITIGEPRFLDLGVGNGPNSGDTPDNPEWPGGQDDDGGWTFDDREGDQWFDPPMADTYIYKTTDGTSRFDQVTLPDHTDLDGFTEADDAFTLIINGIFEPVEGGETITFTDLNGVSEPIEEFRITDISPRVDGGDSQAFPTFLSFENDTGSHSFTMTPIPEPATVSLLALGAGLTLARRRRRA